MKELSCSCGLDPEDDCVVCWYYRDGWTTLNKQGAKRRRRCGSCQELISLDDECLRFSSERKPDEIEEAIFGEDSSIGMAPTWYCGRCGEIFECLDDAGFCFDIRVANMDNAMREYHELTGFKPLKEFGRKK